ncbi:MAG: hypothetical protein K2X51_12610 [Burkholderiales bacterium]|nr:hypothetical protein [Burkholderiales bacterium]
MTFRITHFDMHGRRRRMVVAAASNAQAMALAERVYGDARQLHAIRIDAPKKAPA